MEKNTEREKLEECYRDIILTNTELSRKLVSFQANKISPFYRWFSFKEGFSVEIVKKLIKESSKKEGKILDPFSGSGTTIFASREEGFDSLGIELMPIGEFILKSRVAAESTMQDEFMDAVSKIKNMNFNNMEIDEKYTFKHIPITNGAFPEETEAKLNAFLTFVNKSKMNANIKQMLLLACFCILEKISYTRKDGQYLRWDGRANKTKTSFNKGKIWLFEEALFDKLNQMMEDLTDVERLDKLKENKNSARMELIKGSTLELLPSLKEGSIDLIISSPPYCNRYDYTRTYALELAYLGVDEVGLKELRQNLLSATVENKEKTEFLKKVYERNNRTREFERFENVFNTTAALNEILEVLAKYKSEGKLNNPGIYRMVKNYFYEHVFIIGEMARILKKGGKIYYVNDNVRYAGEIIPVDLILSEFARQLGLKVKKIYKLGRGKGNSSQQMGIHGRQELRKCVYLWEK